MLLGRPVEQTMEKAWVEQGTWRSNWPSSLGYSWGMCMRWKHQDPLEIEGEMMDEEWLLHNNVTNPAPEIPRDEEERRCMERRRKASRPIAQLQYQVGKACERLVVKYQATPSITQEPADIGTLAYNEVKERWVKRGMWNPAWGVLPGRRWKHENPFEDMLRIELPEAFDRDQPAVGAEHPLGDSKNNDQAQNASHSPEQPVSPLSPGIDGSASDIDMVSHPNRFIHSIAIFELYCVLPNFQNHVKGRTCFKTQPRTLI
ncbi:hypothetical protein F5B21DRAFT_75864 [Xylaria acuta]|nr:hypothetical protein F5B21DRAFT_75864 [Xylaria acuta]